MHTQVDIGEPVILRVEAINTAGDHANPTTIALVITLPDGTTVTKAIADLTTTSTGIYTYTYVTTQNGVHEYRFSTTGAVVLIADGYFLVGKPTDPGPCDEWITPSDVFALAPASGVLEAARDYGLAAEMAEAATRLLFVLSHRVYTGICKETVRPCRRCETWPAPNGWAWNGSWGVCACHSPSFRACGCGALDEIQLGGSPILGVSEVRIDGVALARTAYRVDDSRWLVRIDGDGWPGCQDLTADPDTDDDTFEVTFYYGKPPPADAVLAAKRLAGDLYGGATGSLDCVLPANVQSIVRQGVEYTFGDPTAQLTEALTALREVDLFLTSERYGRSHRTTLTVSPDLLPNVRRVG